MELLRLHPAEKKPFLFYNDDKRVDTTLINTIKVAKYSLILICPEDICVHVKQWPKVKQVTMSFDYEGNRYWYIRITDTEFENRFLDYPEGNYRFDQACLFVVSLGDEYKDGMHYKLIAQVLYI